MHARHGDALRDVTEEAVDAEEAAEDAEEDAEAAAAEEEAAEEVVVAPWVEESEKRIAW